MKGFVNLQLKKQNVTDTVFLSCTPVKYKIYILNYFVLSVNDYEKVV